MYDGDAVLHLLGTMWPAICVFSVGTLLEVLIFWLARVAFALLSTITRSKVMPTWPVADSSRHFGHVVAWDFYESFFHQITVRRHTIPLTAFVTSFGLLNG